MTGTIQTSPFGIRMFSEVIAQQKSAILEEISFSEIKPQHDDGKGG